MDLKANLSEVQALRNDNANLGEELLRATSSLQDEIHKAKNSLNSSISSVASQLGAKCDADFVVQV